MKKEIKNLGEGCGVEEVGDVRDFYVYVGEYKQKVKEEIKQWYTVSPKYRTKERLLEMIDGII